MPRATRILSILIITAMVTQYIEKKLVEKSTRHRAALRSLEAGSDTEPLSDRVIILKQTPQLKAMSTIIQDIDTSSEDFIFYFDRASCLLIEEYVEYDIGHILAITC